MIHKFRKNEKNIVVDSNSGAVHIVDDIVYDVLDFYNPGSSVFDPWIDSLSSKYGRESVVEAIDELNYLVSNNQLFSDEIPYDKVSIESPIKAMCLNVAHNCQLRCKYCFASHGDFGGNRCLMDEATAKNSIDFLILNSADKHNLEVDFFGGEPMMNFGVVKKTVEYARKVGEIHNKNFRFTMTTNGLALDDDKIDFLNSEMSNIVMSLDGRKKINDFMRVTNSESGCYDAIVKNFQKIVKKRGNKDYYIRGTYTKRNLDFSKDVIHLYNLGFKKISLEPVVIDDRFEYSLSDSDIDRIEHEYDILSEWYYTTKKVDPDLLFFHFNVDFNNTTCLTKRLKGCGCGNDYVAVTPNGDIYPCHQFVGKPEYLMGNVNDNMFNSNIRTQFIDMHKESIKKCNSCWFKRWCSPCLASGCNKKIRNKVLECASSACCV